MPFRVEKQAFNAGSSSGGGFSSSSSGFAVKGSVCPTCRSPNYISSYSAWHAIMALLFFPIGLISFAFPVKTCDQCGTEYGPGKEMKRLFIICALIFVGLVLLFIAGLAKSA